ncbi:MAG: hypothetical protein ABR564_06670 [Candidatus Dormibacteria bacterium]
MTSTPADRLATAIETATIPSADAFAGDAVLDATVPDWRFTVRGAAGVTETLSRWFDVPGHFEELRRTPLPNGELLEFALLWALDGVPHMCHQIHRLEIQGDRIIRDTAFCGGRWSAARMAEMAAAADE